MRITRVNNSREGLACLSRTSFICLIGSFLYWCFRRVPRYSWNQTASLHLAPCGRSRQPGSRKSPASVETRLCPLRGNPWLQTTKQSVKQSANQTTNQTATIGKSNGECPEHDTCWHWMPRASSATVVETNKASKLPESDRNVLDPANLMQRSRGLPSLYASSGKVVNSGNFVQFCHLFCLYGEQIIEDHKRPGSVGSRAFVKLEETPDPSDREVRFVPFRLYRRVRKAGEDVSLREPTR